MEEDDGMVEVCTTMSFADGVTLQKEVILDVTSVDGSGESILQIPFTAGDKMFGFKLCLGLVGTMLP